VRAVFGADVKAGLLASPSYSSDGYEATLPEALRTALPLDSDGDGVANLDEIARGSSPSIAEAPSGEASPDTRDAETAFRRVSVVFCGTSPTFEQSKSLADKLPNLAGDD
jgi:hypothetical protein